MRHGPLLFLGAFVALSASFAGLIIRPQIQLGNLGVAEVVNGDGTYPAARPGLAAQGREVYRANGCFYCHSQQVQGKQRGLLDSTERSADIDREWGHRQTTARDYIYDRPVMLGSQRIGPDLTNFGAENSEELPPRILRHLYNPRMDQGEEEMRSTMPAYPFLFEKRKLAPDQHRSKGSLDLMNEYEIKGYEVVPKHEAIALVAYLMSLNAEASIPEAPLPLPPGAPAASTNAVATAGMTNGTAGSLTNAPAGSVTNAPPVPAKKADKKGKKKKKGPAVGSKKAATTNSVANPPKQ